MGLKRTIKKHGIYILIILALSLFFFHNLLSTDKIRDNIHYINDITFVSHNFKESVFEYNTLYLWTPYYYSGRPLYAQPEYYFIDLNVIYILLFQNIFLAMNLTLISYLVITGIGMYFLFLHFKPNNQGALIASILYMFNGFAHSFVFPGNLMILEGYALMPFIFLFFSKALKNKNYIFYSTLASLFLALQIFTGGVIFSLYTLLLIGLYALFYLIGKNFKIKFKKTVLVVLIFVVFSFGLSAIKLLPGIEFLSLSNRGTGISYQEYLGNPVQLKDIGATLITNLIQTESLSVAIGFVGFFLFLFSLTKYKKKRVLFFIIILIFSILMAVKSPLSNIFYQLLFFNKLRHIERALILAAFSLPILSGFGYLIFLNKVKNCIKAIKYEKIIFIGIILLILVELLFLQRIPQSVDVIKPKEIPINNYISEDKSTFRTMNLALSALVGQSGYNYLSQLGIGTVKGGGGIWFNDYLEYLSVAQQYNPSRLWGVLNTKYIISDHELRISNLKFVDKFSECKECVAWEAYGPYLYENEEFLPRAYAADNAILVLGADKNMIYSLLLNKDFNPKNTVIIAGKNIEEYTLNELNRYKLIVLTKEISQNSLLKLKNYADVGGKILPDIFNNKNTLTNEDIENVLSKFKGNLSAVEISYYSPNKIKLDVDGKKGFLVLSERYAYFLGWESRADGKKLEILKTNNVISAVYLDGNINTITFDYKPKTFKYGAWISAIAITFLMMFFSKKIYKNYKNKKDEP